ETWRSRTSLCHTLARRPTHISNAPLLAETVAFSLGRGEQRRRDDKLATSSSIASRTMTHRLAWRSAQRGQVSDVCRNVFQTVLSVLCLSLSLGCISIQPTVVRNHRSSMSPPG